MHRVTIFWKIQSYRIHAIQVCDGLPLRISLNGEQYLDATDEQYQRLMQYQREGLLEFRHKELAVINGELQPVATMSLQTITTPIESRNYENKQSRSDVNHTAAPTGDRPPIG